MDGAATAAIERVDVVGCGLMGSGIAEACARAGLDVVVVERDEPSLRLGEQRVAASLDRALRFDKLGAQQPRRRGRGAASPPT